MIDKRILEDFKNALIDDLEYKNELMRDISMEFYAECIKFDSFYNIIEKMKIHEAVNNAVNNFMNRFLSEQMRQREKKMLIKDK